MNYALVKDLFFRSKMDAVAAALGKRMEFVSDTYRVTDADLVLVDLEEFGLEGIQKIVERNPGVRVVSFLSHTRTDLIVRAKMIPGLSVYPRSVFTERLKDILSHAH